MKFKFEALFNSRFQLDGAFYTLMGTKPVLQPNRLYTAKYIRKENGFIQAEILGRNGEPVTLVTIEIK